MATNTFAVTDKVLNEALMVLENQLAFSGMVNRQYSDEYNRSNEKIGTTVKVKKPPRYTWRSGATATPQDTTETTVTIGPIAQGGVDLEVTSLETLSNDLAWKNFTVNKLRPAIATIANKIDYDGCGLYVNVPNLVGTAGTTPATSLVLLQAQQKLDEMAAPRDGRRYLCVDPAANGALIDGMKGLFHAGSQVSDQFRNGLMANNVLGFREIGVDQNIRKHIGGAQAGTPAAHTGSLAGPSLTTDGWTGATTVTAGTVFTYATGFAVNPQNRVSTGSLQQFTIVSAPTVDGGGAATLSIYPAIAASGAFQTVTTAPVDSNVLTLRTRNASTAPGGDPQNLAFHQDAFTLAMVDLPIPGGVHYASRKVYKDLAMRVIAGYDIINDKMIMRFDVAYAWAALYPELACRVTG